MERFLYRLSKSDHANKFILKGALMLRIWGAPLARPTLDIDMLGVAPITDSEIISQVKEIISLEIPEDGLIFDPESVRTESIAERAIFPGTRVRFQGALGTALINMQLDFGYGDEVYPQPEKASLPTLLDSPAPCLLGYSRESAVAEKLEAMVKLGMLNSRMKDFFDIWLIANQSKLDGGNLAEAISRTFARRGTGISTKVVALTNLFAESKQIQWAAFLNRLPSCQAPSSLLEVVTSLSKFLTPILEALTANKPSPSRWKPGGPWS
jgi:nucleotidyltransferase AbiEii toxin of type IV toxin-antitoxin system